MVIQHAAYQKDPAMKKAFQGGKKDARKSLAIKSIAANRESKEVNLFVPNIRRANDPMSPR